MTQPQPLDLDAIEARWKPVPRHEHPAVTVTGSSSPGVLLAALAHAPKDFDAMAVEIRRLRAELAEYEVLNPQQCPAGRHADWLVDSEYAHACPWCEIERLKAPPAVVEAPVVADDTIWLERRPCGCIVAVVVAHVPGEWKLTTGQDAAMHFHPTEGDRRRAAEAGLTVEPVTGAQYREQYRNRWHCNRHAAAASAADRP